MKKKRYLKQVIFTICLLFASILVCSQSEIALWKEGSSYTDSSVFQYVGREILRGKTPYVDTFDHKGPLVYLINSFGLAIGGVHGIWIVEVFFMFVTFVLIYSTARALKCSCAISLALVFISVTPLFLYYDGGNLVEEYALPFIAAGTYIFVEYFVSDKINKWRLIVCGICFACVCMLRLNMISLWIVMCVGVLVKLIMSKTVKQEIFKLLVYFLMGTMIVIVPIIGWLTVKGALKAFIDCTLSFNMMYSSRMASNMMTMRRINTVVFFINHGTISIAILFSLLAVYKERSLFSYLQLTCLIVSLVFISLSGVSYNHYGMIIIPQLVFGFAMMLNNTKDHFERNALICICIFAFIGFQSWTNAFNNAVNSYVAKEGVYVDHTAIEVASIIKQNTSQDEDIVVLGNWDIVYNLADRYSASRYSFQDSPCTIDEKRIVEYCEEIKKKKPKIIVLNESAVVYPETKKIIECRPYEEIYNAGQIHIYKWQESV